MSLPTAPGALLVGTWVNSFLYTAEFIQAVYYYCHFRNDHWLLKLLVVTACTCDALSMIANYACVYLTTIIHAGDPTYLPEKYWPVPLYMFTTGIVAALVQSFLVVRYWRLTKNTFLTMILFIFVAASIGGAFACGMTIATYPALRDQGTIEIPQITWFVAEAETDVCIALALSWEVWETQKAFTETKSVLYRLVAQIILTGAIGAIVAFAALIAYLINSDSNVPVSIAFCLGRVYILTMLVNLNTRNTETSKVISSNKTLTTQVATVGRGMVIGEDEYIDVHQTVLSMAQIENRRSIYKPLNPERSHTRGSKMNDSASFRTTRTTNDAASLRTARTAYDAASFRTAKATYDSVSILSSKNSDLFLARSLNRTRRVTVCV
ncbi:hypothetical protein B0H19DRAFT_1134670 [Mycena capillaripes]|nr:hypothetical protein B0H19DRAFT_1134670 [Mycena capillaripes]